MAPRYTDAISRTSAGDEGSQGGRAVGRPPSPLAYWARLAAFSQGAADQAVRDAANLSNHVGRTVADAMNTHFEDVAPALQKLDERKAMALAPEQSLEEARQQMVQA